MINQKRQSSTSSYQTLVAQEPLGKIHQDELTELFNKSRYPHFYQTLEWNCGLYSSKSIFFILTYRGKTLQAYSIVRRIHYPIIDREKYLIERGPVFSDEKALYIHLDQMMRLIRPRGIWLKVCPYIIDGSAVLNSVLVDIGFKSLPLDNQFYNSTVVVDLKPPIHDIKSRLRRSLITQLNKAERINLAAKICENPNEFVQFFEHLNFFRSKKGLDPIGKENLDYLFQNVFKNQKKGIILYTELDNSMLAGITLFRSGNRIIYEWGFSSFKNAHRKLPLSHILHWEGIKWAKKEGYSFYDFGGYWADKGNTDPINRFKTGFSNLIQNVPPAQIFYFRPRLSSLMTGFSLLKRNISLNFK